MGVVVVLVIAAPLALAVTRRWAPLAFLLLATAGETALFLAVAATVSRARPPVEHLSAPLPPTSSFPSGHVAAATVTYGAIALLVRGWAWGTSRWAALAVAIPVPVGVALSRLYRGVHYPTGVLASMAYAGVWLAMCWRVVQPDRGSSTASRSMASASSRATRRRDDHR